MQSSSFTATGRPSVWRFFPIGLIGLLGVVVMVNVGMIWSALSTFPGAVNDHAFDTGNSYNAILAAADRQAALGWHLEVATRDRLVSLRMLDQAGQPLAGVALTAEAAHPVGPPETTVLEFRADGDRYVATESLPGAGQWDLAVTAVKDGHEYRATRRALLP